MSEILPAKPLTPAQAQRAHQAAILATLPEPRWMNISPAKLFLYDFINDLEGVKESSLKMLDPWAPGMVMSLIAHQESDDRFGLIDGRHRHLYARRNQIKKQFHCAVFHDLTREQIVALFLYHNNNRRNPGVEERYLAAAASGDPVALRVQKVLRVRGATKEMRALTACQQVILLGSDLDDGEQMLNWSVRMLTDAFPSTDKARFNQILIKAMARFWKAHGGNPKLREDRVLQVMTNNGKFAASQLRERGGEGTSSGAGAVGHVVRWMENRYADFSSGNRL